MAFLSKGKKMDLYNLASELRVCDKVIDLREKINTCIFLKDNEQFEKEMLDNIVEVRKSLEVLTINRMEREDKCLAEQRTFELEKLKLQVQNPPASAGNSSPQTDSSPMRLDLKTVLPTFIPDKDDIPLFLTMFERLMKLLNAPADFWLSHFIRIIPSDISRFKLTADHFRVLFRRHQKQDPSTRKDFFFELRTFFEGWLNELEINLFEILKDLIIADQIKKCPPNYKNYFLDTWEKLNDPVVLAEKLDSYENAKPSSQKLTKLPTPQELNNP
ncbi:retrovirus-related Pol polyprotein from transposon 412 [Trichonephila clavipes]|uniref:Retrovirus-related Pol polyprotein from transposon 412 n=1 Tax=Trichonephila clavipes TaxID=2585209 RepID=A0A8X7B990_TRICX|nr:retrovirus-related Pol polyprotein from transposon 412 [Trichonephila clavipes]